MNADNIYARGEYRRPKYSMLRIRSMLYLGHVLRLVPIRSNHHVLEIGAGCGYLAECLKTITPSVIGVDIDPIAVMKSCKDYLQIMDAQDLKFADSSFDIVVSAHTIEHIPDIQKAFSEIERVLRPGGFAALIYPWEPIRGCTVLPEALFVYRTLKVCRQFHLRTLRPRKIDRLIAGSDLVQQGWKLFGGPHPMFLSVLRKGIRCE